jgi:hypothetical protein
LFSGLPWRALDLHWAEEAPLPRQPPELKTSHSVSAWSLRLLARGLKKN